MIKNLKNWASTKAGEKISENEVIGGQPTKENPKGTTIKNPLSEDVVTEQPKSNMGEKLNTVEETIFFLLFTLKEVVILFTAWLITDYFIKMSEVKNVEVDPQVDVIDKEFLIKSMLSKSKDVSLKAQVSYFLFSIPVSSVSSERVGSSLNYTLQ
ncbi:hypothetical protein HELRODRAFT_160413 [Helobdella robusta]|uniref:Uncharacterized protein n=1 Tax=Helobdella robusta TaxID=6412 RepID=T1EQ79_HELRO|nr:hypothetical protein HELRODRAFT_160413 [Helobdella robusta]ESO06253.1 hypothetical protein HELRODRAFT_160413 [Helobdella robusta]